MITATMTSAEVHAAVARHYDSIMAHAAHKFKALRRQCIRLHVKSASTAYIREEHGMRLAIVLRLTGNVPAVHIAAHVPETNEWVEASGRAPCSCYTMHYIHRYAERVLGMRDMPLELVLMKKIARNNSCVLAYHDDTGRRVYAGRDGLSLCVNDARRGMLVHRTFVSMDMLKDTQREAHSRLMEQIDKYERFCREHPAGDMDVVGDIPSFLTLMEAEKIYGKFFNDKKKRK